MNKMKLVLAASVALGALIPATYSFAAEQPAGETSALLGEVIVTARRVDENLQDVPVAVSVLPPEEFAKRGAFTPVDLTYTSPGLTVTPATGERAQVFYNIRGQSYDFGTTFPAVITYFNEVPISLFSAGQFFDLANIQILRGPQGVVFGRVTDGGNVMVAPQKPTNEYEGNVEVRYGNYDLRGVTGAVNLPLARDVLMVRAAFDIARRDGFTQNVITGKAYDSLSYDSFRLGITFRPSDRFENYTVVNYQRTHDNGTGVLPAGPVNTVALTRSSGILALVPGVYGIDPTTFAVRAMAPGLTPLTPASYVAAYQAMVAQQDALGPRKTASVYDLWNKRTSLYFVNTSTVDLSDAVQMKAILGLVDVKEDQASNYSGGSLAGFFTCHSNCGDGSPLPFVSQRQYSGELRFAGKIMDDKLSWALGTYHDLQMPSSPAQNNSVTLGILRRVGVPYSKTRSAAGYGNVEFDAGDFMPGLKFNGGLRYTEDRITTTNAVYLTFVDAPLLRQALTNVALGRGLTPAAAATAVNATLERIPYGECKNYSQGGLLGGASCTVFRAKTNVWTYTFGASYETEAGQMFYAKHSRGYRPGGINSASGPGENPAYGPEYNRSTELGLKADWRIGGAALRTNIAAYYDKFTEIQKSTVLVNANGVAASALRNIGEATIKGVEFEGQLVPTEGLRIGATFAYTDAQYKKDNTRRGLAGDPCNPTLAQNIGFCTYNRFAYTPKYQGSISLDYTLPVDEAVGEVSIGGRYYAQSKVALFGQSQLNPFSVEDSYGLVDLNAQWKGVMGSMVDLSLFANNVTNKTYRVGTQELSHTSSTGIRSNIFGAPRMYGVALKYRFGPES